MKARIRSTLLNENLKIMQVPDGIVAFFKKRNQYKKQNASLQKKRFCDIIYMLQLNFEAWYILP